MLPRPWTSHLPAGTTLEVSELTAAGSLPAAWASAWGAAPEAPLLLDAASVQAGSRGWVTAGEFEERTRAVARRLRRAGVGRGDRMVWAMSSSVDAAAVVVGALRAGVVVVPTNPAYTARELAHIVGDAKPVAAVVDDPNVARSIAAADAAVTVMGPELGADAGDAGDAGGASHDRDAGDDAELDSASADDLALIAYTSGTTGAPKGAMLSHANVLANSESVARTWRWDGHDRLIHCLPIFHGHGLCVALFTSLLRGASVVLLPRFDAPSVVDAATEHHATLFFGVPTMYHRLAASGRIEGLGRLRLCVSGSAPLAAPLHREISARAGVAVLERYGMTETLMTLSNPYDGQRRAGTVGFPFPGVDARVVDGEIQVRGPSVFDGYLQRPSASVEAFTDGWFRTGDLAVVEDGYVRILGRSVDLVISGGFNVYPAEVEDVLLGHRAVAEVAVTGTPSDEWGEVVTAWVVAAAGGGPGVEQEILAYGAEHLAPYKRPRLVHIVDALPRNALGKVTRAELR